MKYGEVNPNLSLERKIILNLYSAFFCSIVENVPFNDSLREVGLSKKIILDKLFPKKLYYENLKNDVWKKLNEELDENFKMKDLNLYFVRKIFCEKKDYDFVSKEISNQDTLKFKVLKIFGNDPKEIGYKGKDKGLEAYLIRSKNSIEVKEKTNLKNPFFSLSSENLDMEFLKKSDQLLLNAFYHHTPKNFEDLINFSLKI